MLSCLWIAGQAEARQSKGARTCRILFLSAPHGAPTKLHLFDGVKSQEVELPRRNFSPVYKLPAGKLKLQLIPDAFQTEELLPAGAPAVIVSEEVNDLYLLVFSDPSNKVTPVKMEAVNANNNRLGEGEMLWFNLTNDLIYGKLGSRKVALKPGESKSVGAPMRERGAYPVELFYKRQGSEHIHPICHTKWRFRPASRSLVFVLMEPYRKAPMIYSFRDLRKPGEN